MSLLLPFRIGVTGSASPEQDYGRDVNDFWAANNGGAAVFQTDPATGLLSLGSCQFVEKGGIVAARVDFIGDNGISFNIGDPVPLGLHVNALVTQQVDNAETALKAQLLDWFGYTANGFPVCPGLVSYTNPGPITYTDASSQQQTYTGGQSWKRTPRGSVLIYPDPSRWRRT